MIVVGIDPAATRLAMTTIIDDTVVMIEEPKLGPSGAQAASQAYRWTTHHLSRLVGGCPALCVVEEPVVGRNMRSTIVVAFTAGAVLAAAHDLGCLVRTCSNTEWKKGLVGLGNATKAECADWLTAFHPELAERASSQDLVDSTCIALWARQADMA